MSIKQDIADNSYIVIMKRDLTVSVAFTAISLFSMLRLPLNVIPTFVCAPTSIADIRWYSSFKLTCRSSVLRIS